MYISLVALSCLIICSVLTVDAVRYYDPAGGSIQSETTGPITGDCWQSELCKERCLTSASKAQYVGSLNDVLVCCPFCERSGLALSSKSCNCRHNGPDGKYQPTEQELKDVAAFKRQHEQSGVPPTGTFSVVMVTVVMLSLLVILKRLSLQCT